MAKWIIKHTKLLTLLFIAISVILIMLASGLKIMKPIYLWLIFLIATFAFVITINTLSMKYLKNVAAEFENTCQPEKYIELLMLYYKSNPKSIVNQMNYSVALMLDRNNIQTARMLMETINANKIPEKSASLKYVFYNNLTLIYIETNELERAEEAYNRAEDYYNKIKNEAIKAQHTPRLASLACSIALKKNDLEKALTYLPKLKNDTLLAKVSYALVLAKIYILKNEINKAKEQLSFVIENAGKICDGQEAIELLSNIS